MGTCTWYRVHSCPALHQKWPAMPGAEALLAFVQIGGAPSLLTVAVVARDAIHVIASHEDTSVAAGSKQAPQRLDLSADDAGKRAALAAAAQAGTSSNATSTIVLRVRLTCHAKVLECTPHHEQWQCALAQIMLLHAACLPCARHSHVQTSSLRYK